MLSNDIQDIIIIHEAIEDFWTNRAYGWAPDVVFKKLQSCRLDRLTSFAKQLDKFESLIETKQESDLILAWVILGTLTESILKWFLCIYLTDYKDTPVDIKRKAQEPEELFFLTLIDFYKNNVWNYGKPLVDGVNIKRVEWLNFIRRQRNTIHCYKECDVAGWNEWSASISCYRNILLILQSSTPYPDEYPYPIKIHEMIQTDLDKDFCKVYGKLFNPSKKQAEF